MSSSDPSRELQITEVVPGSDWPDGTGDRKRPAAAKPVVAQSPRRSVVAIGLVVALASVAVALTVSVGLKHSGGGGGESDSPEGESQLAVVGGDRDTVDAAEEPSLAGDLAAELDAGMEIEIEPDPDAASARSAPDGGVAPPADASIASDAAADPSQALADASVDAAADVAPVDAAPTDESPKEDRASARTLYRQGSKAFLAGKLGAARRYFRRAVRAAPGYAPAYRGLGLVYQRQGNRRAALKHYRRYLRLAPRARDAGSIRARIDKLNR